MYKKTRGMIRGFICLGVFLFIFESVSAQTLRSARPSRQSQSQRGQTIEERVDELSLDLNLSSEQRKKIIEILTRSKQNTSKAVEEISDKIKAIKAKAEAEVEAVLTKEQRNKYKGVPEEEVDDETILKVFKGTN